MLGCRSATKTTGPVDIKDAAEVVTVLIRHGKRYLLVRGLRLVAQERSVSLVPCP